MRQDHVILLAIAASYVVAVPCVRRMMVRDEELDSARAFGMWLLWPLVVAFVVWSYLAKVPGLMFPTPQVTKVKQRLRESAAKHDDGKPAVPPNRSVPR